MSYVRQIKFWQVSILCEKSGKCVVCGKPCKLSKKFCGTMNPYNLNKMRQPKTEAEIRAALYTKRDQWMMEPVMHQKCSKEAQ